MNRESRFVNPVETCSLPPSQGYSMPVKPVTFQMYIHMYYYVPFSLEMVLSTDKLFVMYVQKAIAMFDHNISNTNDTYTYIRTYVSTIDFIIASSFGPIPKENTIVWCVYVYANM